MHHDILGDIKRSEGDPADAIATIRYESRDTEVWIIPDDKPEETTLNLAAEVVTRLERLDKAAKRIIVTDLRGIYNSGWNEYDEVQEDGSLKTVSNPQLSESAFEQKFSLIAITVTGDEMIDFFYDDSRLFWGHTVLVTSLNGIDFSGAHAELFG